MHKCVFVPALTLAVACNAGTVMEPGGDPSWRENLAGAPTWQPSAAGVAATSGGTPTLSPVITPTAESQRPVVNTTSGNTPPTPAGSVATPVVASAGRAAQGGSSATAGRSASGRAGAGGAPAAISGSPSAVGSGDISHPVSGPAPSDASKVSGAPFVLVKNWDFGAGGTIKNSADLSSEFLYTDQWGTIANGSNYGAVIVAPSADQAVSASGLGLPGDRQPVEDPARPTRQFTDDSLLAHVRPLSTSQSTVTVSKHDAGCGSFTAKWKLPGGGALLGKDLLWETRVRIPVPLSAYWFAVWTAGNQWNKGAEMDVVESFGAPQTPANAFHTNSVGGQDSVTYGAWPEALDRVGVPQDDRDLKEWHTWTWVYLKDDSYVVYYDGHEVQRGTIHWTNGGGSSGAKIDMSFLFDFGWGHTQISDVNISLPASKFPLTYEIDYSRVYLR